MGVRRFDPAAVLVLVFLQFGWDQYQQPAGYKVGSDSFSTW